MSDAVDSSENIVETNASEADNPIPESVLQGYMLARQRSFWRAVAIVLLIGAVLIAFGLYDTRFGANNTAPDFTLTSYNGSTYHLNDLHGKVVVLNFWASWCGPCRAEEPAIETVWSHVKDSPVVFLGVDQRDTIADAQAFLKETGVQYPTGLDNGIVAAYGIQGLPTTIVIDQNGKVVNRILAAVDETTLQVIVQTLLGTPQDIPAKP